jgi:hypothetical protein
MRLRRGLAQKDSVRSWLRDQAALERRRVTPNEHVAVTGKIAYALKELATDRSERLVSNEVPLLP